MGGGALGGCLCSEKDVAHNWLFSAAEQRGNCRGQQGKIPPKYYHNSC